MSEQEKPLAQRLRDGATEVTDNLLGMSKREVEVLLDMRTIFLECADTIEQLEASLASSRQHANNLYSAVGELTEELEFLQSEKIVAQRRNAGLERSIIEKDQKIAELSETFIDEHQTVWCPPTAWAYAQVCRVKNEQRDEIERLSKLVVIEGDIRFEQIKVLREYIDNLADALAAIHPHVEYEDESDKQCIEVLINQRDEL